MFKCSLDISLDYLRYYSKVPYILDIASLKEWVLTEHIFANYL